MKRTSLSFSFYRWIVIFSSFVVMMIISIYQYSWFLFAYSIQEEQNWTLASVGLTFTVFAYCATFIQPFSGLLVDTYGPKRIAVVAAVFVGIGFILSSFASSPILLYLFYGFGGLGVGVLYGISTACAVKWFPDKRGLATGIVVFGFGAGTAIFNWFIQRSLVVNGLSTTLLWIGFAMIAILVPLSMIYRYPDDELITVDADTQRKKMPIRQWTPKQMLASYQWYLLYFCFIVTVSIVLMFGAQMKMLARDFDIPSSYFNLVLFLFPLGNGLSRILAGIVSDRIGRERTMMLFYSILGLAIISFVLFGHMKSLFIITIFASALMGGAPFALYPATIGDYYGAKYSTVNYGITYTAKAWAGLVAGWLTGYLADAFGSFTIPLLLVGFLCLLAAVISNPRFLSAPNKDDNAAVI